MRFYILVLLTMSGCVSSLRDRCVNVYNIDSIGGCDSKGFCGVTGVSRTGRRMATVKQYPVLTEEFCSE